MPNPTFDEIVKAADEQIARLQASERALNTEINAVRAIEWQRPLNADEREQLAQLRRTKASVLAAIEELSLLTVSDLDQTDEVKRLLNAMEGIQLILKTELNDIKHTAAVATSIADAIQGIASLAAKLAAIVV